MERINSILSKEDLEMMTTNMINNKIKELSISSQVDSIYSIALSPKMYMTLFKSLYYDRLNVDTLDISKDEKFRIISKLIYISIPKCYVFSDDGTEMKVMLGLFNSGRYPEIINLKMPITYNEKFRKCVLHYATIALGVAEEHATDQLINSIINNVGIEFEMNNNELDLDAYALRI